MTENDRDSFERRRSEMIERQLRRRGVADERVLEAMGRIPRELFMPKTRHRAAYADGPAAIGFGQTISQPYIVALMSELISPRPNKRVLEIGSGSGYQAAVLAACGCAVYSLETVPRLHRQARRNLERAGLLENVQLRLGNGYAGWPAEAPFDAALLTCAPPEIPETILEQVSTGGVVVGPRGRGGLQELVRIRITPEGPEEEHITGVLFVPMVDESAE